MGLKFSLFATLWMWVLAPTVYLIPPILGINSFILGFSSLMVNFLIFEVAYLFGRLAKEGSLRGKGFELASFKIVSITYHNLFGKK